ncbi:prokaryotic phospholipase A2-domain-containing protein [Stachybotrys elegans]|uniref:Prokaryotic phospholipase A2-domain-containing protein n=1 Tax=Stachybotrys elegans TaxID=80388 RepID=A0A8K0WXW0_9HYPO|nr:prokaryotic phospholipase A2-domain-containing protein [Stachybotrys elegans]
MKAFTTILALASAVAALPASVSVEPRQSLNQVTDQLLYDVSLATFISRRNARNPSTLDWSSDGCTTSPDNPLGFPFIPACYRHDFGYQNYRLQSRFTQEGKLLIDNNFRDDLYFQCSTGSLESVCRGLANVYYAAVRAFGGGDATRADPELVRLYEEAVAEYERLVQEAKDAGLIEA